eukprot:TRINITY_DN7886_c0_g1_i3.p1 TRINITY_DN7886_c0_g1~~TRINITY_DN7886_c0_g1_i3.p1  ORF type:complete len:102 (-),score=13.13 TRINITY_DN7886_c0_g1_i3:361-666(-)
MFLNYIQHTLQLILFFFLMIRRPPRSTLSSSSAASDVYKRQIIWCDLHKFLWCTSFRGKFLEGCKILVFSPHGGVSFRFVTTGQQHMTTPKDSKPTTTRAL